MINLRLIVNMRCIFHLYHSFLLPLQTITIMAIPSMSSRIKGALWAMYIGDSLAMPVHWYYDRSKIFKDFGREGITKYEGV